MSLVPTKVSGMAADKKKTQSVEMIVDRKCPPPPWMEKVQTFGGGGFPKLYEIYYTADFEKKSLWVFVSFKVRVSSIFQ